MKRYYILVGCLALLLVVLALTRTSAYWPALPLLFSCAVFGEMTADALYAPSALKRRRLHKVLVGGLATLLTGLAFNIVLLTMMGTTVLLSLLLASIAYDMVFLETSKPEVAPSV